MPQDTEPQPISIRVGVMIDGVLTYIGKPITAYRLPPGTPVLSQKEIDAKRS